MQGGAAGAVEEEPAARGVWEWRRPGAPCGPTPTWEHTVAPNEAWPPLADFIRVGDREVERWRDISE